MAENENEDAKRTESLLDQIRRWRTDADKGREPELLSARLGSRQYSVAALIERIVDAFIDEHGGGSDALHEAGTETRRLKLILATVDYVLAVESIQMTNEDKAALIRSVYHELFTYGPLDALFADETITTITLEGADKVAVRHGHGDLKSLEPIFEDEAHLRKIIQRLLIDSGAALQPEMPIIETGLAVSGRPININLAGPPATIQISADIRLHPVTAPTLEALQVQWTLPPQAVELIRAIVDSEHGIAIIGEAESGKTTFLNALIGILPETKQAGLVVIEHARALRLPQEAERFYTQWAQAESDSRSFGQQIEAALAIKGAAVMVLDEVRADQAQSIGALLGDVQVPRQIWVLRGPASSKRLVSALGMLARRSGGDINASEDRVRALYERLPVVITLRRREGRLEISSISEWQFPEESDYPIYVELMATGWEGLELTGRQSQHPLDLPESFWSVRAE